MIWYLLKSFRNLSIKESKGGQETINSIASIKLILTRYSLEREIILCTMKKSKRKILPEKQQPLADRAKIKTPKMLKTVKKNRKMMMIS